MTEIRPKAGATFDALRIDAPLTVEERERPLPPIGSLFGVTAQDQLAQRDLVTFRAMLDGKISIEEGMRTVSHSGGWPIRTTHGYLFAHPSKHGTLSIIGDHDGWARAPDMERHGELLFLHLPIDSKAGTLRYKLWDGAGEPFADPWARRFQYEGSQGTGDREISFIRTHEAHLERWPQVSDGRFSPRELHVWMPKGPIDRVIYMHDGQNLFRPNAMHGSWGMQHAVGANTVVVGIPCELIDPRGRFDEYTDRTEKHDFGPEKGVLEVGGRGVEYADFCNTTVRDFIESRLPRVKRRAVIGSSLGAVAAYLMAKGDPNGFDLVGCLSGTFAWGERSPLVERVAMDELSGRTIFCFYSGGTAEDERDNYEPTLKMAEQIAAKAGYRVDENLFHAHREGGGHNEKNWREFLARDQHVKNPIRIFESL